MATATGNLMMSGNAGQLMNECRDIWGFLTRDAGPAPVAPS
jgi:hypothetical protein